MNEPKRRETRRAHLDAAVVPLERALLARVANIGSNLDATRRAAANHGIAAEPLVSALADAVAEIVAGEFRALAEELRWW